MDNPMRQRHKPKTLNATKLEEELAKAVESKKNIIDEVEGQPIVYDYMKYPSSKAKGKLTKSAKPRKTVTFKVMVELVTFTDNWKMQMIESKLRTEEEQLKCSLKRRNF
ncbi:uncharacterized protein LOC108036299 [Drosophila biarmipes]|uniref:uncharacterized protein LOC108036299 n=1 Tax=Drosophila biarmipes TaxID=125945 RepID=UPI0007E5E5CF|nr:uncharacterized protein LOC108036299 [Drosophila biarmipes]